MLHDVSNELHECINDTGFILVVLDSMSLPVLTKKSKHKIKELKNVEEHIFHPGGDSNHYCSMMTNMPRSYATYPLSQTSDRSKNRLAVFAVKLRESMKAYLSEKDDWPTSYYSECRISPRAYCVLEKWLRKQKRLRSASQLEFGGNTSVGLCYSLFLVHVWCVGNGVGGLGRLLTPLFVASHMNDNSHLT